jgi:hypothetical protein
VTAVQPSFRILTSGPPAFTIGSMARTIPGSRRSPAVTGAENPNSWSAVP